ncbi:RHS repeat-associated core domain-containing protein [Bacteroidaceae bacterium HV4-6-C5C]|nr:RHS repeat-associated core domain-containing protein [Bacteroidaceae bacterium HV4-6-C5C]
MLSGFFLLHRLIFSQDGRQRAAGIWSFTIPDIFGRACITGTCTGSYDALALTSPLNGIVVKATRSNTTDTYKGYASSFGITLTSPTVFSVNYYDDYAFIGSNGIDSGIAAYDALTGFDTRYTVSAKTFLTGTLTAQLLPNGTVSSTYLYSVMYYDYKGRVIQTKGNNPLSGGTEKAYIAYNFSGQPLQKKHIHAATGKDTQTELYTYTYDDALRLKTTQYSLNKGAAVTLASNTYDELGRLKTSTRNGQANLATTYNYNVRSWLISSSSPLFNQTLYYNDTYAGSTARYNGNISAMSWKMSNEIPTRGYKFSYDNLSRLTAANYLENGSANDHFNTAYAYDKQGNMTSLARKGNTGTATYGDIDVLTMTYAGNQLVKAEDTGSSVSLSASMDFKNNSNAVKEYSYDANGNLIQDLNKGINGITYNLLNLPQTLTISNPLGSATNSYTYAADGRKLKTMIGSKTTDYCGSVIYENGVLKRILVEGEYIEGGTYYFYLTDHLGNNRVVANASGTVLQTNHYYPFGMSFPEGALSSSQPYKYNGKELDTDRGLNLYDYSARYMDPALGRFSTVDSKAEKCPWLSPYIYVGNNPLKFIDPNGKEKVIVLNPNDPKDASLIKAANNYKDDGAIHVWAHGNPREIIAYDESKGTDIRMQTGNDFKSFLNENSDTWRGRSGDTKVVIVLHSCETGKETSNSMLPIAGKISKALDNAIVIAPTEKVVVDDNTKKEIGTYSTKTVKIGGVDKTVKDKEGTWSEYSNGKKTDSYPGNKLPDRDMTRSTWNEILDFISNLF